MPSLSGRDHSAFRSPSSWDLSCHEVRLNAIPEPRVNNCSACFPGLQIQTNHRLEPKAERKCCSSQFGFHRWLCKILRLVTPGAAGHDFQCVQILKLNALSRAKHRHNYAQVRAGTCSGLVPGVLAGTDVTPRYLATLGGRPGAVAVDLGRIWKAFALKRHRRGRLQAFQ
jgi:hypothetical protein